MKSREVSAVLSTRSPAPLRTDRKPWLLGVSALVLVAGLAPQSDAQTPAVDYARDVAPILKQRCYSCHGPTRQRSGLRLDKKADAFLGGDSGPAIVAGEPAKSPLLERVLSKDRSLRMPPEGDRLSAKELDVLERWIAAKAPWPETTAKGDEHESNHWAFEPIRRPTPQKTPGVELSPVDAFIAARLAKDGLSHSPEAVRTTLIRRLKFTLLGLPPTPEETKAFLRDDQPGAYERLVDSFLASPRHGERWARHWLDIVRFAESDGFEMNQHRPNAWHYRDYVIRALNENKPFDRFVTEQLAGDVLGQDAALGFLVGGPYDRVKSPDVQLTRQQRADELNDIVGVTSTAFLGLTLACARCHDHKFDPATMTDYYRVAAVFAGVQHGERPLPTVKTKDPGPSLAEIQAELRKIDTELAAFEPEAYPLRTIWIDDANSSRTTPIVPRTKSETHRAGTQRGQQNDPGDIARFPNLGKSASFWSNAARRDVFTWNLKTEGRFRIWLSWACGSTTHSRDARYVLDLDGDLATKSDQTEIARVDQRNFADGKDANASQSLWSGFFDAGVHTLTEKSRILLRGGDDDAFVTADLIVLQEEGAGAKTEKVGLPRLRNSPHRDVNIEKFAPVTAKFVRFTVLETNGAEPCIDEWEVFSAGENPVNVALATTGTKATASSTLPGHAIHKLDHINDGRFGNDRSWISNEPGKGWVQLELTKPTRIDRMTWSRDRGDGKRFADRTPTKYVIEAAETPGRWVRVASSDDRLPFGMALIAATMLNDEKKDAFARLVVRKRELNELVSAKSAIPAAYVGRFTTPEPTFRLHRGDVMQQREKVAPGGLSKIGPKLELPIDASEQARRTALAKWMVDPQNPLTARVFVNRLWQYHFGVGIVATPSDFGRNGARPTHPELLDWLADEFIRSGWNIRHIHRIIVTSKTYRQASRWTERAAGIDSQSRLLWRFPPRRLEAEPIRDSILQVTGKLDLRMGGPGFDLFEPNANYVKVYTPRKEFGPAEFRRMIYQSKPRMQLDDVFGVFDCPDGGQTAPKRNSSTTPLQALSLLNSRFIVQQAEFFANRLSNEAKDGAGQVRRGFELAFQREPSTEETRAALSLIHEHGLSAFTRALLNANEFLYIP